MTGRIAALFQYPIKGFTPQSVERADLAVAAAFPGDRLFAVEDGPSGFDPDHPRFITKQKFTVLAKIADVARARTHYDTATGRLRASAPGRGDIEADLHAPEGRRAFARWLTQLLGEAASGELKVLDGGGYRFLDDPKGHVSILNLASVVDLADRLGRPLDPLRFRANIHVEGWAPWLENAWAGRSMRLGEVEARVIAPIVRCAAPAVDPTTAVRDVDVVGELYRHFGHMLCGVYVHVTRGGAVAARDAASVV